MLGLEPVEERPGGLRYTCAAGSFSLFESTGAPSGEHTQLAFEVTDLDATVRELRERGVVFEEVDVPGLRTIDGIATVRRQLSVVTCLRRTGRLVPRQRRATCSASANRPMCEPQSLGSFNFR